MRYFAFVIPIFLFSAFYFAFVFAGIAYGATVTISGPSSIDIYWSTQSHLYRNPNLYIQWVLSPPVTFQTSDYMFIDFSKDGGATWQPTVAAKKSPIVLDFFGIDCVQYRAQWRTSSGQAKSELSNTIEVCPNVFPRPTRVWNDELKLQSVPLNGGIEAMHYGGTYIWAVGNDDTKPLVIRQLSDGSWEKVTVPAPGTSSNWLYDITGVSSNKIWAVGYYSSGVNSVYPRYNYVLFWDGSSWKQINMPNPDSQDNQLTAISAASSTIVWAVGNDKVFRFDGTDWTHIPTPTDSLPVSYLDVQVRTSTDVLVSGTHNGKLYLIRWNGSTWQEIPPTDNEIGQLSAFAPSYQGRIDAVGSYYKNGTYYPLIGELKNNTWVPLGALDVQSSSTIFAHSMLYMSYASAWFLGSTSSTSDPLQNSVQFYEWDGDYGTWTKRNLPNLWSEKDVKPRALLMLSGGDIYIGGSQMANNILRPFIASYKYGVAAVPTQCSEDLNKSGKVDLADLSIILSDWAEQSGSSDLDQDGIVGIFDFVFLLKAVGKICN